MMNSNRLYVDFHVLQTVPPSCVNRDDLGSPKTAVYGGVIRHRVSSQAWKRAMRRDFFTESFPAEKLGLRTKKVVEVVREQLKEADPELTDEKAEKMARDALKKCMKKKSGKEKFVFTFKNSETNETDVLFFISVSQAKALARLALEGEQDSNAYLNALKESPSIDMALFGRMVASEPSMNYDAAAQVAHAISTHEVRTEYDYFSAVDDCQEDGESGAGHIGTAEFNSSTLYRYATLNVMELVKNLKVKEDVLDAVEEFAKAFICTMPTGKQNSYANRTLPDAVYVAVRTDQPVNLCAAYEKPIPASCEGYIEESKRRLSEYTTDLYRTFAEEPKMAMCCGKGMENLGNTGKLKDLFVILRNSIDGYLMDCEVV